MSDEPNEQGPDTWASIVASDGVRFEFANPEQAVQYLNNESYKWHWLGGEARLTNNAPAQVLRNFAESLENLPALNRLAT